MHSHRHEKLDPWKLQRNCWAWQLRELSGQHDSASNMTRARTHTHALALWRASAQRHENERHILCLLVLFKRLKETSLHHLGGATTDDATPPPPTLILKADARTEMERIFFFLRSARGDFTTLNIKVGGAGEQQCHSICSSSRSGANIFLSTACRPIAHRGRCNLRPSYWASPRN